MTTNLERIIENVRGIADDIRQCTSQLEASERSRADAADFLAGQFEPLVLKSNDGTFIRSSRRHVDSTSVYLCRHSS